MNINEIKENQMKNVFLVLLPYYKTWSTKGVYTTLKAAKKRAGKFCDKEINGFENILIVKRKINTNKIKSIYQKSKFSDKWCRDICNYSR